jgi:hypothetical protein
MAFPRTSPLALSIVATLTALTLTGCSAEATAPVAIPTKSAGLVTKDLSVCFSNNSTHDVTVNWDKAYSTSTFQGTGVLSSGSTFCGEGSWPYVPVIFADGFKTWVDAANLPLHQPSIGFINQGPHGSEDTYAPYALESYGVGQTITNDVKGHAVAVTRGEDSDWINFTITFVN